MPSGFVLLSFNQMTLRDSILNFNNQLSWQPKKEEATDFHSRERVVVCGMGGSHLGADFVKALRPEKEIRIWSDYGLPKMAAEEWKKTTFIFSSYSGNTEETLHALSEAKRFQAQIFVIASGGELLRTASEEKLPHIELPDKNLMPRFALGYNFMAVCSALGENKLLEEANVLAKKINPIDLEKDGEAIAAFVKDKIPVFYSSRTNRALANVWKVNFNEGVKIPAFFNRFPELNHNEMDGVCGSKSGRKMSRRFGFIFLWDEDDFERTQKRMSITEEIYRENKLSVMDFPLRGETRQEKIWNAFLVSEWAALSLARRYRVEPESGEVVEKFKARMKK